MSEGLVESRRVAVITGASSGIGAATAEQFLGLGYQVYNLDQSGPELDSTRWFKVDVTSAVEITEAVEEVLRTAGQIDVLVCCAGVKVRGTLPELTVEEWDTAFAVNTRGVFLAVKAVLPAMQAARSGCVVTIASASSHAERGALAYAASKGAILAFTRSLALDCLRYGVRVNAVLPGFTTTGMAAQLDENAAADKAAHNVAGRLNEARDVARVVAFLASDAAQTMSGAVIDVAHVEGEFAGALSPKL